MNSDHVQRYHVRQDGLITDVSNGEWVKFDDVKRLLNYLIKYSLDRKYHECGLFPEFEGNWVMFKDIEQLFKED